MFGLAGTSHVELLFSSMFITLSYGLLLMFSVRMHIRLNTKALAVILEQGVSEYCRSSCIRVACHGRSTV